MEGPIFQVPIFTLQNHLALPGYERFPDSAGARNTSRVISTTGNRGKGTSVPCSMQPYRPSPTAQNARFEDSP